MKRDLSIYLDLLRLIAALGVFLGHGSHLFSGGLGRIGFHAAESVAVFFVLSGFVIAFVTSEKEFGWASYSRARVVRIYSVALLALIVTLCLDFLGSRIEPDVYANISKSSGISLLGALGLYLVFLNEAWGIHSVVGSNEPYWSLGFEVWYYVIFGIVLYARGWVRGLGVALALLIVGPYVAAYFLLWLLGVVTYRAVTRGWWRSLFGDRAWLSWIGVLAAPIIYYLVKFHSLHGISPVYEAVSPGALAKSFIYFMMIGGVAAISIVAFASLPDSRQLFPDWSSKLIKWLAGGSFTLYLVHLPVLTFLNALAGGGAHGPVVALSLMLGALVICYGLAELGERRKRQFAAGFDALLRGFGLVPRRS